MNEETLFKTTNEQLSSVMTEISETKKAIRELSFRLSQIERHLKRAFPRASTLGVSNISLPQRKKTKSDEKSAISSRDAIAFFDSLKILSTDDGGRAVNQKMESLSVPDLKVVAHEVGLTFKKKPSRKKLEEGIMRRLRESIMLNRNINITSPLSEKK